MTLARALRRFRCDRDTSRTLLRPATVLERDSHAQNLGEKRSAHDQFASRTIRNATDRKRGGKAFLGTARRSWDWVQWICWRVSGERWGLGNELGGNWVIRTRHPVEGAPAGGRAVGYARLLRLVVQE